MTVIKRKYVYAVISVILVLSVIFSQIYIMAANAAAVVETDLSKMLTYCYIIIDGKIYDYRNNGEEVYIDKDASYEMSLTFTENDRYQFTNDSTPMRFILPDAVSVPEEMELSMDMNLGFMGVLKDNRVIYDKNDNALVIIWNTSDTEKFEYLCSAAEAEFSIDIMCGLEAEKGKLSFGADKFITLKYIDRNNASVKKSGMYDPAAGMIEYTVTVFSDGTTENLYLEDIMGTALKYTGDCIFDEEASKLSETVVPVITNSGTTFSISIPKTNDGDEFVFRYSAVVDINHIARSGNATFAETGNTVNISGDSDPTDNTAVWHENKIEFSDLVKDNKSVGKIYKENGKSYRDLTWQIVTNRKADVCFAGTYIKDSIDESVQAFSEYTGRGIEIFCYDINGQLCDTRYWTWEDLGVDVSADKSWTYHIPDDDPSYKYVVNYKTRVDMSQIYQQTVIKNIAEGKGGEDTAYAVVTPEGNGIAVDKKATDIKENEVTWVITVSMSGNAFDEERLVLTEHSNSGNSANAPWQYDCLPHKYFSAGGKSYFFREELKKIEVVGLYDDETFELIYNDKSYYPQGDNSIETDFYKAESWSRQSLQVKFFKDRLMTQGGLNKPEYSDSRVFTVKLTASFSEEWAQKAKQFYDETGGGGNYAFEHLNWVDVNDSAYNVAKFSVPPVGVYKRVLRSSLKSDNRVVDGNIYPVYLYQVLVGGVDNDSPIVIEDTFNTELFRLLESTEHGWYIDENGTKQYTDWRGTKFGTLTEYDWMGNPVAQNNGDLFFSVGENNTVQEVTENGLRFTFNEVPKKADGSYYNFYGVQYWLTVKDFRALAEIERIASKNEGDIAIFPNIASCRGDTATAQISIPVKNNLTPVNKSLNLRQNNTVLYTIDINPAKLELNDGKPMYAIDKYSANLSVFFNTVNIVSDPPCDISYDFSGNKGTFNIPDSTHVTITYEAKIIGSVGSTEEIQNDVELGEYSSYTNKRVVIQSESSGHAANTGIYIYKFGAGHMEQGLNGAEFRLYEVDENDNLVDMRYLSGEKKGQPIIFTTEYNDIKKKDGYAHIFLSEAKDGLVLHPNKKYAVMEITAPAVTDSDGQTVTYKLASHAYKFTIADVKHGQTADYSQYIYFPEDIMTVRNYPESVSLTLNKDFIGNFAPHLTQEEKNAVTFDILRLNENGVYEIIAEQISDSGNFRADPHFNNIPYSEFVSGSYKVSGFKAGDYIITENIPSDFAQSHPDVNIDTSYTWADGKRGRLVSFDSWYDTVRKRMVTSSVERKGVIFTVTQNDPNNGRSKEIYISNHYVRQTVNLQARKKWLDVNGNFMAFPSELEVEFKLYTAVNGTLSYTGKSVILDGIADTNGEEKSGVAFFRDMPKYLDDGVTPVQYVVRESSSISGYDTVYTDDSYSLFANNLAEIKNKKQSTSVSATKVWKNAENIIPENTQAVFALYSKQNGEFKPVANVDHITLSGADRTVKFENLPKTDDNGHEIEYAVREISCTPSTYQAEYSENNIITNHPAVTDFSVTKKWEGTPHNEWADDTEITLTLQRKNKYTGETDTSFSAKYVLTKNAVKSHTLIKTWDNKNIIPAWLDGKLSLSELEKYSPDGNEWVYFIREETHDDFTPKYIDKNKSDITEKGYTTNGGTVINEKNVRELTVKKTVTGNMGSCAKDFEFMLDITGFTENSVSCKISDSSITSLSVTDGKCIFTLRHEQQIKLYIPFNAEYTLSEKDYTSDGYETSIRFNNGIPTEQNVYSDTMTGDSFIEYINEKNGTIPTGINIFSFMPVMILAVSGILLAVAYVKMKRE